MKVLLVVLLAPPLVADPPVVLPLTFASPLLACCSLVFVTVRLLVLVTTVLLVWVEETLLLELGPVLLRLPVAFMLLGAAGAMAAPAFDTVAAAATALLFVAAPVVAPPPVVFHLT